MKINAYIAELLMEYNCVVVPKFGAFIGNYKPAQLNNLSHKISPPSKLITFNPKLFQNDGLLISHATKQNGVDYQSAENLVSIEVEQWKKKLQVGETINLCKVGTLVQDSTGVIHFERDEQFNLLKDSFGLEPFFLKERSKKLAPKISEQQPKERKKETKVVPLQQSKKVDWKKIAVAAAFIPLVGYLLYLPTQTNLLKKGKFHYSELNPFSDKVCEVYQPRQLIEPVITEPSEEIAVNPLSRTRFIKFSLFNKDEKVQAKKIVDLHSSLAKPNSTKVVSKGIQINGYHIIVGCFSEKLNAVNLVSRLKTEGAQAFILDRWKGLYRTSIASYSSKSEAIAALEKIRAEGRPNAWLVKK